jgi:hypothetical protein
LLAGLVAVTAACAGYSFPSSTGAYGTVTGQVVAVPCSPVENPDAACKPRPAGGVEIDFSGGGQSFATRTGADGRYTLGLPPGTWTVALKKVRVISGPKTVVVRSDASVVADYVIDSGIRVPGPAA